MNFPHSTHISLIKDPLDWTPEKNESLVQACIEMAEFHSAHCPDIKALYQKYEFSPKDIRNENDLLRIPCLNVHAMKYHLFTSLPEEKAVLKLTSSGTRGQKTQIWFDQESLDRVQGMLDVLWEQEGLTSDNQTNYLNFIYDPEQAQNLGIAFSVANEQRFAPIAHSYFAVKKNNLGHWEFQIEDTLNTLEKYCAEALPVRLLGIPSFIFELIQIMEKRRIHFQLPDNSYILVGGGWKAAEEKAVTRERFRELVEEKLGIPDQNVRDEFGMAEHSAPYIECPEHKFHIPVYNRVFARDPVTLTPVQPGEVGLLEFLTPFNAMMPTLTILSTDLGSIDPKPCSCGRNSPTFTLVGRGGLKKHKGCAITANEIVRRD